MKDVNPQPKYKFSGYFYIPRSSLTDKNGLDLISCSGNFVAKKSGDTADWQYFSPNGFLRGQRVSGITYTEQGRRNLMVLVRNLGRGPSYHLHLESLHAITDGQFNPADVVMAGNNRIIDSNLAGQFEENPRRTSDMILGALPAITGAEFHIVPQVEREFEEGENSRAYLKRGFLYPRFDNKN